MGGLHARGPGFHHPLTCLRGGDIARRRFARRLCPKATLPKGDFARRRFARRRFARAALSARGSRHAVSGAHVHPIVTDVRS